MATPAAGAAAVGKWRETGRTGVRCRASGLAIAEARSPTPDHRDWPGGRWALGQEPSRVGLSATHPNTPPRPGGSTSPQAGHTSFRFVQDSLHLSQVRLWIAWPRRRSSLPSQEDLSSRSGNTCHPGVGTPVIPEAEPKAKLSGTAANPAGASLPRSRIGALPACGVHRSRPGRWVRAPSGMTGITASSPSRRSWARRCCSPCGSARSASSRRTPHRTGRSPPNC